MVKEVLGQPIIMQTGSEKDQHKKKGKRYGYRRNAKNWR